VTRGAGRWSFMDFPCRPAVECRVKWHRNINKNTSGCPLNALSVRRWQSAMASARAIASSECSSPIKLRLCKLMSREDCIQPSFHSVGETMSKDGATAAHQPELHVDFPHSARRRHISHRRKMKFSSSRLSRRQR
jgi:hypothetical protein